MIISKPYVYQAQLFKTSKSDSPKFVVLLSDRHAAPLPEWAVAHEQSEAILSAAVARHGCIIVEDAASAVMPFSADRQILFAKRYEALSELDLCCAAISVTTEPKLCKMASLLHDKKASTDRVIAIRDKIAADGQTHACRPRVISQLQESCLLFFALRAARRGIEVENVECRHPEVDRTTWAGLKKMMLLLDNNLKQVALLKECPLVGVAYKRLEALGYKSRAFDPVAQYMRSMRVVADPGAQIMDLMSMEDRARLGSKCFKEVVRSMLSFFSEYGTVYTPIVYEVSRLSLSDFYSGAQDLIFSVLGAPIVDLKILKGLYEHRDSSLAIVCAGGYHIESIRPFLEAFGYTSVVKVGGHNNSIASPPVNMKRFFDVLRLS